MANYTPTYTTGLLTCFDTEVTWQKQFFLLSSFRLVKYTSTRAIYDTLANAEAAAEAFLNDTSVSAGNKDGAARRINDAGWAETIFTTITYGPWRGG